MTDSLLLRAYEAIPPLEPAFLIGEGEYDPTLPVSMTNVRPMPPPTYKQKPVIVHTCNHPACANILTARLVDKVLHRHVLPLVDTEISQFTVSPSSNEIRQSVRNVV